MTQFSLNIEGEEQVSRLLSRTTERASDLRPFIDWVGDFLPTTMKEQFDSEGGRTGGWAPLSPDYAAQKALRYGSQPILVASGRMMRSLTTPGAGSINRKIGRDSLEFGTSVPYAIFHQKGTSRMPQRRIIDLTESDRRSILKGLQKHLFGARL